TREQRIRLLQPVNKTLGLLTRDLSMPHHIKHLVRHRRDRERIRENTYRRRVDDYHVIALPQGREETLHSRRLDFLRRLPRVPPCPQQRQVFRHFPHPQSR